VLTGDKEDNEGYLRTGDLGFIHCDELFVCGREKDLIIIRLVLGLIGLGLEVRLRVFVRSESNTYSTFISLSVSIH
jgi:hypothetical protein